MVILLGQRKGIGEFGTTDKIYRATGFKRCEVPIEASMSVPDVCINVHIEFAGEREGGGERERERARERAL